MPFIQSFRIAVTIPENHNYSSSRKKMKKLIILITILAGTLGGFAQRSKDTRAKIQMDSAVKTVYTCPMHPDVVSNKPGKCPKCGMELVAKKVKTPRVYYTCSMHPEVVSDKPGKCPKCGMDLIKKEGSAKSTRARNMKMDSTKH
jgi:hypothetical protein